MIDITDVIATRVTNQSICINAFVDATNFENDETMLKKYLKAFRELEEPYSREMWTSWGNPFNGVWPTEAGKITQVMDNLGWFQ